MHVMLKRFLAPILSFLACPCLLAGCASAPTIGSSTLLHRSTAAIRSQLLAAAPLGSTDAEVRFIVRQRDWDPKALRNTYPPPPPGPYTAYITLGAYEGMFGYNIVAVGWSYDARHRLTDVSITKTHDAL